MKLASRPVSLAAASLLLAAVAPAVAGAFIAPSVRLALGLSMPAAPPAVLGSAPVRLNSYFPGPAASAAVLWGALATPAPLPVPAAPAFVEPAVPSAIESVRALGQGLSPREDPGAAEPRLGEAFDGRARPAVSDAAFHAEPSIPAWKDDRQLDLYGRLTGLDIPTELRDGGLWVDVGAGRGEAISAMAGKKGVELVAVNAHRAYEAKGAENIYAEVPGDRLVARRYSGRARVVTDVYGAASYSDDAVAALVYESSLLAAGGKLAVVTRPERFGTPETWKRIESYFESRGQRARFELVDYPSRDGRKHGPRTQALRVTVSGPGAEGESLDEALAEARLRIGVPVKVKSLFATTGAELWALDYRLPALPDPKRSGYAR